jgi:hypothetical protein
VSESVDERSSGQVSVNGWHDVEIRNTVHSPARESAEAARNEKFKVHAQKIKIHRFDGKWLTRRVSHLRRSYRLQLVSTIYKMRAQPQSLVDNRT